MLNFVRIKLAYSLNFGITLWNALPLKWRILPDRPTPFSPVHKQRKFSAVKGMISARSSISMRPLEDPPILMSKNTTGFSVLIVGRHLASTCGAANRCGGFTWCDCYNTLWLWLWLWWVWLLASPSGPRSAGWWAWARSISRSIVSSIDSWLLFACVCSMSLSYRHGGSIVLLRGSLSWKIVSWRAGGRVILFVDR